MNPETSIGDEARLHTTAPKNQHIGDAMALPQPGQYVPGMDGLRAIACLAVFGVHWQQMTGVGGDWGALNLTRLLQNGNSGVAMFMILSGFLLALPIFAATPANRQRTALRGFWRHRAARILPAYWICLAALVILTEHWRSLDQVLDSLVHFFFLHNLSAKTLYSINPPFWALAVIVQFYVLFAGVIWSLRRIGRISDRVILGTFLGLGIACQLAVAALKNMDPQSSLAARWLGSDAICLEHSLPAHVSIFVFGVVGAWLHVQLTRKRTWLADGIMVCCAGFSFVVLATPLDDRLPLWGGRYNFPVIPLLLTMIVLAVPRGLIVSRIFETRLLRRLGVISYGFYLFHLPVMRALNRGTAWFGGSLNEFSILFAITSVSATVLVCECSFRILEAPLSRWLRSR